MMNHELCKDFRSNLKHSLACADRLQNVSAEFLYEKLEGKASNNYKSGGRFMFQMLSLTVIFIFQY